MASDGFTTFAARMRLYAGSIPLMSNEIKKSLAREFVNQVIPATPIDTSKARNNYQVSINSAANGEFEVSSVEAGGAFSLATLVTLEASKAGDTIYIRNNIKYIYRLNAEGYSPQARAGFVERALEEAVRITGSQAAVLIAKVRYAKQ